MKICAKWTLLKFCPREGCLIVSWGKRGEEAERVALHFQASFPFPSITRGFLIVSSGDKSSSHHSDASLPLLCPMSVSLLSRPPERPRPSRPWPTHSTGHVTRRHILPAAQTTMQTSSSTFTSQKENRSWRLSPS